MEWLISGVTGITTSRIILLTASFSDRSRTGRVSVWGLMSPLPVFKLQVLCWFICQHLSQPSGSCSCDVTFFGRAQQWMKLPPKRKCSVTGWAGGRKGGEVKVKPAELLCHCGNTMEAFFWGGKFKLVLHVCSLQIYLVPNPHCVDWQHWSRDSASCPSWGCGASEFPELPSLRENFKSWLFVEMVSDPFFLN